MHVKFERKMMKNRETDSVHKLHFRIEINFSRHISLFGNIDTEADGSPNQIKRISLWEIT